MARISPSQMGFGELLDSEAEESVFTGRLFGEEEDSRPSKVKNKRRTFNLDPEELRRMYVDQEMSLQTIAEALGCTAMTIHKRLVELEIPRRDKAWKASKPVTEEWLRQKYLVEGLDCTQISELVGRDSKSVWNWLVDFGIPRRGRGSYSGDRFGFKKGHTLSRGRVMSEESKEKIRQARIKDGHVPYLKDGVHYLKGKRGAETPNWKGGATPERQKFYDSEEWKIAARTVWARDNAKCRRCGKDHRSVPYKQRGNFALHHIISFAYRPLRAEPSNLVLLCRPCHLWVHSNKNVNKEFITKLQKGSLPLWLKPSLLNLKDSTGNSGMETPLKF